MFRRKQKTQTQQQYSDQVRPIDERPPLVVAVPRPHWRFVPFLLSHLAAGLLIWSWLRPETRRIWDLYDAGTFRFFTSTLAGSEWWLQGLAAANGHKADLVAAVAIGLLMLWNIRFYEKRCIFSGWLSLGVFTISVLLAKELICGTLIHDVVGFQRASPSTVMEASHRVSELVPEIQTKDSSPLSFPGDHGFVLMSVALYMVYRGSGRQEMIAWLFLLVFGLPRVIVGAHWATDIVVGSSVVALLFTAWLMATPLHDRIVNGICWRLANSFAGLFNRRAAV
jgi:membrane-associated phospholipid phosphatase